MNQSLIKLDNLLNINEGRQWEKNKEIFKHWFEGERNRLLWSVTDQLLWVIAATFLNFLLDNVIDSEKGKFKSFKRGLKSFAKLMRGKPPKIENPDKLVKNFFANAQEDGTSESEVIEGFLTSKGRRELAKLKSQYSDEESLQNDANYQKLKEEGLNRLKAQIIKDQKKEEFSYLLKTPPDRYKDLFPEKFRDGMRRSVSDLSWEIFKDFDMGTDELYRKFIKGLKRNKDLRETWDDIPPEVRETELRDKVEMQLEILKKAIQSDPELKSLLKPLPYAEFDGYADTREGVKFAWSKFPKLPAIDGQPKMVRKNSWKVRVGNRAWYDIIIDENEMTGETILRIMLHGRFKGSYNFTTGRVIVGK